MMYRFLHFADIGKGLPLVSGYLGLFLGRFCLVLGHLKWVVQKGVEYSQSKVFFRQYTGRQRYILLQGNVHA